MNKLELITAILEGAKPGKEKTALEAIREIMKTEVPEPNIIPEERVIAKYLASFILDGRGHVNIQEEMKHEGVELSFTLLFAYGDLGQPHPVTGKKMGLQWFRDLVRSRETKQSIEYNFCTGGEIPGSVNAPIQ